MKYVFKLLFSNVERLNTWMHHCSQTSHQQNRQSCKLLNPYDYLSSPTKINQIVQSFSQIFLILYIYTVRLNTQMEIKTYHFCQANTLVGHNNRTNMNV